jgi:hypothetical protein
MASYVRTSDHLAIVFDNGENLTVYPSNPNYTKIVAALKAKNDAEVRKLATPPVKAVEKVIQKAIKRGVGSVQLRAGIVYYNDEPIHNSLADRIVMIANEGFDIEPMTKFLANLQENPSFRAVNELYGFLEKGNLPITEDGHFLAYKRVKDNYKDIHSGTFDNSVGVVVSMPRNRVNEDPEKTCEQGLHFCSRSYLSSFGNDSGHRTMILKINPRDVVAIPTDYNHAKGRCCLYEVIGELEHSREAPLEGSFRPSDKYVAPIEVDEEEEYETEEEFTAEPQKDFPKEETDSNEKIVAYQTNGDTYTEFDTIQEAAKFAFITPSAIRRVLKGDRKTAGGYHWKIQKVDVVSPSANLDPDSFTYDDEEDDLDPNDYY